MQPGRGRAVIAQCAPCGQEIDPRAESGFHDRKALRPVPTSRQVVAIEEDVLRLGECALGRRIDVFETRGIERAVGAEAGPGGNDGLKVR